MSHSFPNPSFERSHLKQKLSISFIGSFIGDKMPNLSAISSQIPGFNIIFQADESQDFLLRLGVPPLNSDDQ